MTYSLELSRQAERYLDRLDPQTRLRIADVLRELTVNPFGSSSKALAGYPGRRSARVGAWRILFTVRTDPPVVRVSGIGPRGQIYRELGR